jgi:hypothetical protein
LPSDRLLSSQNRREQKKRSTERENSEKEGGRKIEQKMVREEQVALAPGPSLPRDEETQESKRRERKIISTKTEAKVTYQAKRNILAGPTPTATVAARAQTFRARRW